MRRPKVNWKEEVASGWRGSIDDECSLCGRTRSLFDEEAYFKLKDDSGYWTCHACYEKELGTVKHLLYSRGCVGIILTHTKDGSKTILRVLQKSPWTRKVRDKRSRL